MTVNDHKPKLLLIYFVSLCYSSLCLHIQVSWMNSLLNFLVTESTVVRVWRMRCEHAARVSRLGRSLFTEKVTMVSRCAEPSSPLSLVCVYVRVCQYICVYLSTLILLSCLTITIFGWFNFTLWLFVFCSNCCKANLWETTERYLR